jgi:O-antigen/teichoic acid export membrane protein
MSAHTFARLRRIVHFFGIGVLDQVLLSGASFVAGFVMIRYTNDVAYGQFVLAQSAILLALSAQGAWLSGPANAIAPKKTPEDRRLMIGSLAASQTRLLRRVTPALLLVPLAGYLVGLSNAIDAIVIATTILACWVALERQYLRTVLLIYSRPAWMLRTDIFYIIVWLAGIGFAVLNSHAAGAWAVGSLIAAGWVGAISARRMLAVDPGWIAGNARPFWQELRPLGLWAAVGAVIYWLFAQSYNYVLATRLDLTAVADVNAARLVLMPIFVFTTGINNLLLPVAANWLAESGLRRMLQKLAALALAILAIDLFYFGAAWRLRHWLIVDLMHKTIADQDRLLILWAGVAVIFLLREVIQAPLFALNRVRSMAWMIGISAALSLTVMWRGIGTWGAAAVLIGQIVGECVNLAGLSWLLWKQAQVKPLR